MSLNNSVPGSAPQKTVQKGMRKIYFPYVIVEKLLIVQNLENMNAVSDAKIVLS